MAGLRLEVFWSPNSPDKFLTWGSEISLYQIENTSFKNDISSSQSNFILLCFIQFIFINCSHIQGIQISANSRAYQLGTFTDVTFARSLAWLPVADYEGVLAIGQMNGRILLTSVLGAGDTHPFTGREYASKHNRQCNAIAWGVLEPYMLAGGFDKHRSEHGLIIWDVAKGGNDNSRPLVEFAFGDTVNSLAWFSHNHTLAAGVNSKHLRLYDVRGNKITMLIY